MYLLYLFLSSLLLISPPQNDDLLKKKGFKAFYDKDYDLSIKYFKEIERNTSNRKNKLTASHVIGHIYSKEKLDLKKGITWYKKGLISTHQSEDSIYSFQMLNYRYLGDSYLHLGNLDSAEFYLREGVKLYAKYPQKFKNSSILNQLGLIFFHKKEYHLSKEIQEKDLTETRKSYSSLSNYLHLLIVTNDTINHKIDRLIEELQPYQKSKSYDGSHLTHIGLHYQKNAEYQKAITYYESFLRRYNYYFENTDYFFSVDQIYERKFYIARVYFRMSKCYEKIGDTSTQYEMLQKALSEINIGLKFFTQKHVVIATQIYRALALYHFQHHMASNNYLACAQELIDKQLLVSSDTNDVMKNQLMLQSYYKGKFTEDKNMKATHYWESYQYFKDFISKQYQDQDQLLQLKENQNIQTDFIRCFSNLYFETKQDKYLLYTLEIIENSKSNILYKRNSGISKLSLKDYLDITDLRTYKKKIHLSPLLKPDELKAYFQKHYQDKIFLSYFFLPESMLILGYNQGKFYMEKKRLNRQWETHKNFLQAYIRQSNYFLPRSFSHKLEQLHSWLIPKWVPQSNNERLVASMHKDISFIPLEILKYNDRFMVEEFAISYCFSLHHDLEFCATPLPKYRFDVLGIAPFSQSDLPYSYKEVNAFSTTVLLDRQATYSKVSKNLKKYNIIHFATHTQYDSTDSKILFYPTAKNKNSFTASQINDFDLSHIDLITLSTCSSAEGSYLDGEGTLSLQRSFAYAQVPSILAGKWKVHDQSSMYIMTSFYKYLNDGWTKDIALQKAKKNFIKENENISENPMFWGSFIINGSTTNLQEPSPLVQIETFFDFW